MLKASYGIPDQLVNAMGIMYQNTMAKVISAEGVTDPFNKLAGVLHVDTLAPYLFVIVMDYALRKAVESHEGKLGFQLV